MITISTGRRAGSSLLQAGLGNQDDHIVTVGGGNISVASVAAS